MSPRRPTAPRPVRLCALLAWLFLGTAVAQGTHVLLVLDASGSMYLRLDDGTYRIAAAKDALASFVTRLPDDPDLNVGLRVYGANMVAVEPRACEDSELVVPVAGFDRDGLLDAIRSTQALGATPIAYSLDLAVEDLRHADGRKVVVLVTDGAESCGGDVRAAVERLTAAGMDVDVRIIGFALPDYAIATFAGLGTFENTTSAAELAAALGRAVELAPATLHPVEVRLTRDGTPAVEAAEVRFLDAVDGTAFAFAVGPDGAFRAGLPAGSYRAELRDAFAPAPLIVGGLAVVPDGDNVFAFELQPAAEVAVDVAPIDPVAGGSVVVRFAGAPDAPGQWLTVVAADASDDAFAAWAYVDGAAGEAELRVPDEPATLQARFLLRLPEGGSRVVGRSEPFDSHAVSATIAGPSEVSVGGSIDVSWSGPDNAGDYLTIVAVDAPEGTYLSWAYTRAGSPARLTAPGEPGAYELRYVTGQTDRTIARAPIAVVAADASVAPPAEVSANARFEVAWAGPDASRDYVTIVPAGAREGAYLSWAYTSRGNPAMLTAPAEAGTYEVRYVLGAGDRTLASAPITVVASAEVATTVAPPSEVAAGARFQVAWTGPDASRDYVTIVPAGAPEGTYLSWTYTRNGSPATLTAPREPGAYEVRYVEGAGDRTLASAPITVR